MKKQIQIRVLLTLAGVAVFTSSTPLFADDLFVGGTWPAFASDNKAANVGDMLTVFVYENAQASNKVQNRSSKRTTVGGTISAGSLNESGDLSFGGGYTGTGEVSRSEKLAATISVYVIERYPNGYMLIEGTQTLKVNGETTNIGVRGKIRAADITSNNAILSTKIANAQIDYDGKGFVSRSAKPGIINKIFSFLGIG